jgi:glucan phosphoethanolaminetransferase (alkaline phosphatase superfamily)
MVILAEQNQVPSTQQKYIALFTQFAALLLLWLPNIFTPLDSTEAGKIRYMEAIGLGGILWILAAALCGSSKRLLLICIPFAAILPLELWTRIYYGTPINEHIIALAWESNIAEGFNLIQTYGSSMLLVYIGSAIIFFAGLRYSISLNIHWQHRSRYWYILIFLPALFLFSWVKQDPVPLNTKENPSHSYFDDQFNTNWLSQWSDVFPVNIFYFSDRFLKQKEKMTKARNSLMGKSLEAKQVDPSSQPEIAIVVIGESASAFHWGVFGYSRDTTPALQKRDGIVFFSNVVSLSSATRTAIPGVLSRRPLLTPSGTVDWESEPSFLKAFSEVGYSTHWISNQAPLGQHDTSISIYAQDADDVRFLNPGTYSGRGNYDEVLLKPLEEIISQPGRHAIVMHLMGSHFDYELRYPAKFKIFQSKTKSLEDSIPAETSNQLIDINSYDNSLAYTDYILEKIIDYTEKKSRRSILAYFSDHGVDLPQGRCVVRGASRVSETSFHVPAFLWASSTFREKNKKKWTIATENADQPYSTKAIFSTILDLSGIQIANGLPTENFLVKPLASSPRLVATSNGILVDFDKSKKKNPCYITSN